MKQIKFLVSIISVLGSFYSIPFAADVDFMTRKPADLMGVAVICIVDEELERAGLIRQQVQVDIELTLRNLGIKVLPLEELRNVRDMPSLTVHIMGLDRGGVYSYAIIIEILKKTSSNGNYEPTYALTWHRVFYGVTNKPALIRPRVRDSIDTFINASLSINSRK